MFNPIARVPVSLRNTYLNTNYRMGFITAKFSMIGGQRTIICMEDTRICIHAQFKRQNGRLASVNAMYEGECMYV